jgi:hypothetical protein
VAKPIGLDPTIRRPQSIARWIKGKLRIKPMSKAEIEQRYAKTEEKQPIRYITYDFLSDADFYNNRIVGLEILWVSDHLTKFLSKYGKKNPRKHYNILATEKEEK